MRGTIKNDKEVEVTITFLPKIEGPHNINLKCHIKSKSAPLNLNLKGIGYTLKFEVSVKEPRAILKKEIRNKLDFGKIFVNEVV